MKFAQSGLYIESYTKCANCGSLIYEGVKEDADRMVRHQDRTYCSQECVDWKLERDARHAAAKT
ncbi:hypothetical protein N5C81_24500 [Rhizobium pusense]|uniref:hypothetical protein n=1 Tax=Agrobacterium pusense TaxID=648995 RepID=UPI002448E517|nr:hypothetical protein [Agrobacterium pusense]MDH1270775.1 hypothetical protein [Agrobacterium pusense]